MIPTRRIHQSLTSAELARRVWMQRDRRAPPVRGYDYFLPARLDRRGVPAYLLPYLIYGKV